MLTGSELGLKNADSRNRREEGYLSIRQSKGRKTTVAGTGRGREEMVEDCTRWKGRSP